MMLYAEDESYKQRAAAHDARMSKARALSKAAADMEAIADDFKEPTPSDVMMLHDPRVPAELRWGLTEARKRMNMMTPEQRTAYRPELTVLDNGITQLVARYGTEFKALSKFISSSSLPGSVTSRVIENNLVSAKFAKRESAPHMCDLNYLVDPRVPPALRRRLMAFKNALDRAPINQRRAIAKSISPDLLHQVDALGRIIGADGVAALRRVVTE
jgi:hypothetical protein